jgi:hypothetical protein
MRLFLDTTGLDEIRTGGCNLNLCSSPGQALLPAAG